MNSSQAAHNQSIVEQFTRQAVPFSRMATQSEELLLEMSGVTNDDTVLDVACGPGIVACAFATRARHVTGIDLTPAMIEQAQQRQRRLGLENLTWQVGDVLALPFPDAAFSLVITRYSFHHFLDPEAMFREMMRVCQPGGTVMVVDATPLPDKAAAYNHVEKLKDPSHVRALTEDELLRMAEAVGLQQIRTQRYAFELELETSMQSFFPNPGDDERIRQIYRDDLERDALGMNVHLRDGQIHFAYPVLMLAGQKAA
ncbi:MAG: class I SAM-dependent methyltransferase [Blastocatellia bacterium]